MGRSTAPSSSRTSASARPRLSWRQRLQRPSQVNASRRPRWWSGKPLRRNPWVPCRAESERPFVLVVAAGGRITVLKLATQQGKEAGIVSPTTSSGRDPLAVPSRRGPIDSEGHILKGTGGWIQGSNTQAVMEGDHRVIVAIPRPGPTGSGCQRRDGSQAAFQGRPGGPRPGQDDRRAGSRGQIRGSRALDRFRRRGMEKVNGKGP